MFPKGLIIAFEGLDCSFKSTNYSAYILKLIEMKNEDQHIIFAKFPRYDEDGGVMIKKFLNGGLLHTDVLRKAPLAVSSLFAIDRLDYWYSEREENFCMIDRYKDNNFCFIFDRYNVSNALYNPKFSSKGLISLKDFERDKDFGNPLPDIVVWMRYRDFSVLEYMLQNKPDKDINELDIDYIKTVWERSEKVLKNDYYRDLGIELALVEVLDESGKIKSKEQLEIEVWDSVNAAICRKLQKRKAGLNQTNSPLLKPATE